MRRSLSLLVLFAVSSSLAAGGRTTEVAPTQTNAPTAVAGAPAGMLAGLRALKAGERLAVDGFPDGYGGSARLRFERIEVYAAGARVLVDTTRGARELTRSARLQFLGRSDDDRMRAHLAFDPDLGRISGSGFSPAGSFAVRGDGRSAPSGLAVQPAHEALPRGVEPEVLATDDALPHPFATKTPLLQLDSPGALVAPTRALVAVDVDRELLIKRFGGTGAAQQAQAVDWVADLFGAMNVMYQNDLQLRLELGTLILRSSETPYPIGSGAANGADLDAFGGWWEAHHGGVQRAFAMLLSGAMSSGYQASGIAWLDSYCRKPSYGGSYSVNKVFHDPGVGIAHSAAIVGHELGHNFGARHTHCSDAATGSGPVASNTIDRCFNGEAGSGCYAGPTSCPSSGPGAPQGTLMSYCHINGCGDNVMQFHPAHIGWVAGLIAANTPTCLVPDNDSIFSSGFES